jgi:16S rRNA (cytosine967-C5)-methyltransferase
MIDAPCTGTGVIGKHPDIKWRRSVDNIAEMSELQLAILSHVSNFVKPDGRLVYSTCSLEPEENWNVVDAFLKLNPSFSLDLNKTEQQNQWADSHGTIQTLPHRDKTDGMYAARLIKN